MHIAVPATPRRLCILAPLIWVVVMGLNLRVVKGQHCPYTRRRRHTDDENRAHNDCESRWRDSHQPDPPPPPPDPCYGVNCGSHGSCSGGHCSCSSSAHSGDRCQNFGAICDIYHSIPVSTAPSPPGRIASGRGEGRGVERRDGWRQSSGVDCIGGLGGGKEGIAPGVGSLR